MTVVVVQFGGSNCDRDAVHALQHIGIDATRVWHEDGLNDSVENLDGIILPGGFSYGDYLRAGAMAAHSPIVNDIQAAAERGIPVLGVCNGAQVGCESGLTPGAFTTNDRARFQCETVHLRVENATTPWTEAYETGTVIEIPIAHGEGRFEITESEYEMLKNDNQILFRYCDSSGNITDDANPNGSRGNVAGITGNYDTVAVLMPHPERATLPELGRSTDGKGILQAFG
ncbi:phosphoribosylformylglycinamidine synthase I [Haloquadratum walsbyi]|jgi:phosphoribosylformylglycinamidine synthase I|uniref:Phosphoribosylformylglycinamidine synthase subunit PurQ n=1 Tax=Haloquadratum walsbyi (strain DSM 16854 / JCM 12705 / C23) TaxID=768065 RepID=G0LMU5_HALWC|nr:phosphoribosylformylglycinamidine synthase I [Haloquadratum walsbyi]CCC41415.1 phosphoribosylformylglycinamidine synthase subunit PurQ [Haloquadratum walsbyi C23]